MLFTLSFVLAQVVYTWESFQALLASLLGGVAAVGGLSRLHDLIKDQIRKVWSGYDGGVSMIGWLLLNALVGVAAAIVDGTLLATSFLSPLDIAAFVVTSAIAGIGNYKSS